MPRNRLPVASCGTAAALIRLRKQSCGNVVNPKTRIMSDDKNKQDGRDRNKVAGNEDYEVNYLAEKLGVSAERVREAIKAVGNDRQKIEKHLSR